MQGAEGSKSRNFAIGLPVGGRRPTSVNQKLSKECWTRGDGRASFVRGPHAALAMAALDIDLAHFHKTQNRAAFEIRRDKQEVALDLEERSCVSA